MRGFTGRLTRVILVATGVLLLAVGTSSTSMAGQKTDLADKIAKVDRSVTWKQVAKLELDFPTHHPQGLVVTQDRFYLSSVEIIEPTVRYPEPKDGYDRSPGKGVGHLFVIDRVTGRLIKDVKLGHGIVYHPGGIDLFGDQILVPVAQYRPNSSADIYTVDTRTFEVKHLFGVKDHIGGVVFDASANRFVGNSWGSRTFYEWSARGRQQRTWANPQSMIDFQDCQYVAAGKAACGGVTNLPTPDGGTYELGGVALIDLERRAVINAFPFQQWSAGGHVMTRNPVKLAARPGGLTLWAAPDDGEQGTAIYTWETTPS